MHYVSSFFVTVLNIFGTALEIINKTIDHRTMKRLLLPLLIAMLASCSGVKKTQSDLNTGNYSTVMHKAIQNLAKNKTKKGHQDYVLLLEEAFAKNTERELRQIGFLQQGGNANDLQTIYDTYRHLKDLQERIRPLLPLPVYEENREAHFDFQNYEAKILGAKNALSEHLFNNAKGLIQNGTTKLDFRQAYDDLAYLEKINPGRYQTGDMMALAHQKGMDFILVNVNNDTEQIIPRRLEEELLDFNTYHIDNFWAEYHTATNKSIDYDYALDLDFKEINISPEQVQEKQLVKEKVIKDGYEYVLDDNGNVAKDSLGNDIKVDKFKTISCRFYQFTQLKTAQIGAKITFTDLKEEQEINSYPLSSQFVFEHIYATHKGNKRALDDDLISFLGLTAVPFPTNEQMVYDAGEDLKQQLSSIVRKYGFQ